MTPYAGMDDLLAVGRISRLYGNEGMLSVTLYDTVPGEINKEEPLWVLIDQLPVPLFVSVFRRKGNRGAIVGFDDIDSMRRAEELLGREFYLKKEVQPTIEYDDTELYLEDLVGFTACCLSADNTLCRLGAINEFIESEFNPLFVVQTETDEIFIPAIDQFIAEMDIINQTVVFDLPEGMIELNE